MPKQYTVHVTDNDGTDYCIPGVTDCAFVAVPNGDPALALENPFGDDMVVNTARTTIRHVSRGYTPQGEPCYHADGPTYPDGHTPEAWGTTPHTRGVEPDTHEAFR